MYTVIPVPLVDAIRLFARPLSRARPLAPDAAAPLRETVSDGSDLHLIESSPYCFAYKILNLTLLGCDDIVFDMSNSQINKVNLDICYSSFPFRKNLFLNI